MASGEKAGLLVRPSSHGAANYIASRVYSWGRYIIGALTVYVLFATVHNLLPHHRHSLLSQSDAETAHGPKLSNKDPETFDWSSVTPVKDLNYTSCYGHYQCARLLLPMDWTADDNHLWDNTVAIALIKLPANISVLDDAYGGEIYANPGGPGASGIDFILQRGAQVQSMIYDPSSTGDKVFDLVAFDPRGIANSEPRVSCFDDIVARQLWTKLGTAFGVVDGSQSSLTRHWARAQALGKKCDVKRTATGAVVNEPGELIKEHVSTTHVARDLLEIIERSGQLREARVKAELAMKGRMLEKDKWDKLKYTAGQESLQFWGFSYGCSIGAYFASMYPERVHRLILDGTANYQQWADGVWLDFLQHTEEGLEVFYSSCFAAGPLRCALYKPGGPEVIKTFVANLLDSVRKEPIPVYEDGMPLPELLTHDLIVKKLFSALYFPYASFEPLAMALANVADRTNTTAARWFLPSPQPLTCSPDACQSKSCTDRHDWWWQEGEIAVMAADGPDVRNETLADYDAWRRALGRQSSLFGNLFATMDTRKEWVAWPVRPRWRFAGPFGGRTRRPVLVLGNTRDPVAPVEDARWNGEVFGEEEGGARVLIQDAIGHCSLSSPSRCTRGYIKQYWQTGELPPKGMVCGVDWQPFEKPWDAVLSF